MHFRLNMDYNVYKVLHLVGLMCVFISIGGAFALGSGPNPARKLVSMLHGVGLLVLLVSGFGILAKLKLGFPNWIMVKLVIWLGLGVLVTAFKRRWLTPGVCLGLGLVLGSAAAFLGVYKPF